LWRNDTFHQCFRAIEEEQKEVVDDGKEGNSPVRSEADASARTQILINGGNPRPPRTSGTPWHRRDLKEEAEPNEFISKS